MIKLNTEAKIGIIVLITIAVVIWGINYLKGKNVLKRSDVYYAVYEDIQGIDISAPVLINGYKVGLINNIKFSGESLNDIIIAFTVDHNFDIPENSIVELHSADLLGTKALRIIPSQSENYHEHGDTLISSTEKDMISSLSDELLPLKTRAESAIEEIDSLINSLNFILDSSTASDLKQSINNLNILSEDLSRQTKPGGDLDKTFQSLRDFSGMLSNNSDKLDTVFTNFQNISDSIAKANVGHLLASINNTFTETSELLKKINAGEGSLGLLASNDSLYNNLNSSIESLDALLMDLNENPGRYVQFSIFGGKK